MKLVQTNYPKMDFSTKLNTATIPDALSEIAGSPDKK
jgi:hypothetical protein